MRDTFTKIFPTYPHATPSVGAPSFHQIVHAYPKINDMGYPMHQINREYTHKKDVMKEYTESILKIANMQRCREKKKWNVSINFLNFPLYKI